MPDEPKSVGEGEAVPTPAEPPAEAKRQIAAEVPIVYVDAAQIFTQPFTVQIDFGAVIPNVGPMPRVSLAMSPAFAHELQAQLVIALGDSAGEQGGEAE